MRIRLVLASSIALVAAAPSLGETPLGTAFTYQGQLKEGGVPLEGTADFLFRLFDAAGSGNPPTGGTPVGGIQVINALPVTAGRFTVTLNGGGEFGANAFNGNARWLQIAVRSPAGSGGFTTLAPRQPLTTTPYALGVRGLSIDATGLAVPGDIAATGIIAASGFASHSPLIFFAPDPIERMRIDDLNGNVAIGTTVTSPGRLNVSNDSTLDGASAVIGTMPNENSGIQSAGVRGINLGIRSTEEQDCSGRGITRYGVWGSASGSVCSSANASAGVFGDGGPNHAYGVIGQSNSTSGGRGVFGYAPASNGVTYGVYGESASPNGNGVFGSATAATGNAFGGFFQSAGANGTGVFGWATSIGIPSGTTFGGSFRNFANSGGGVFGWALAGTGVTVGGHFESQSTSGRGVFGLATANFGGTYGMWGQSDSPSGIGVVGLVTATSGTNYGVVGKAGTSANSFGVFSQGNMGANGTKPFRIDHPDDPANKYLLHYAAESPEVINFYSGKATLDAAGQAVIELPHYFAKINKDPRYTLTAVGAPMPQLHVAEEIDEAALSAGATAGADAAAPICSFRIAGGAPGSKVSWRVEALRNDLWVRNRAEPVEVEKQGREKGTYQHPEFYGQPPEKGMNYVPEREPPSPSEVAPQE